MSNTTYFNEQFEQLVEREKGNSLNSIRRTALQAFNQWGIPGSRHEEWKYTRIGSLFNKEFRFPEHINITPDDMLPFRLPGSQQANELVFVNGIYSPELSVLHSASLEVMKLDEAANNGYAGIVTTHLGHSGQYLKDGINALNTAFTQGGVFVLVKKGKVAEHPVYIYHLTKAETTNAFAQPRTLVYLEENAAVKMAETFASIGSNETFTNQVLEVVLEQNAHLEHYKIQNDHAGASMVSTTHIRQVGKSYAHTVVVSLNGNMVRNNTTVVMEAPRSEAHLYGLYFQKGNSHIDNHTIVDNVAPHCESNELYKGILDDSSTGVFNGKIFVRQPAQKTNAFQSNKNILLSNNASINTKPQLEIFADDVKCSHGCTVGQLSEEGLFYLQSRGIPESIAQSMLLQGFAGDVLEKISLEPIRTFVSEILAQRLEIINEA